MRYEKNSAFNRYFTRIHQLQVMAMEKIHNYIIMLGSKDDVGNSLEMLSRRSSWNPNAKFLVFFDWLEHDWRAFIHHIIEIFTSRYLIDVVICIPTNETDSRAKVYIFF